MRQLVTVGHLDILWKCEIGIFAIQHHHTKSMKIVQSDGNYLPRCNYDDIPEILLSMMNWMLWSNSIIVSNDFHIDMNKFVTKKVNQCHLAKI